MDQKLVETPDWYVDKADFDRDLVERPYRQEYLAEFPPDPWQWLSFADSKRPVGSQLLGVLIIEGHDIAEASRRAWRLGINPGGEVVSIQIAPEVLDKIPTAERNRLLSRAEAEDLLARLSLKQE